ncbi:MAG: RecX family transcriptional regulator [Clostridia bacterium]|nr:RecX family transcriptional regulator [Clostridia bacterium]
MIAYSEQQFCNGLSITLRSITSQNNGSEVALRILIECDEHREERRLILSMDQYLEQKPTKGELTEEAFEALEAAAELCRAIRAGEHLLAYGGNTVQMLMQKLIRRGFSRAVAMQAAEELQRMGVINERRDMERELEKCLHKLWGAKRINAQMWARGFGVDAMAELPSLLESIDFVPRCAALIRKHYGEVPADGDEQRRMIAWLARYGYSLQEIRAAMRQIQTT